MSYFLHLFIYFNINAIVALSLNLLMGYCGLLTLAHAGYFALGSYAYALATVKLGWGFFPAVGLGVVLAAVMSLAISLPAIRFKGDFFVLVSLAVQTLLFSLLYNWSTPGAEIGTWQNLTNGSFGISNIPRPNLWGWQLDSIESMAGLAFVTAILCGAIVWLLLSSPWGRLLKVIRDDELAARGLGKNTKLAKIQAVAIACGLAAVAGALYAAYVNYIDPSTASLDESILMTCMVLVGGVGNFRGPLVGAFVLLAIPEALRFAAIPDAVAANIRLGLYGLLLVVMMRFRPQGIAGDYRID
jgi:branched-chain amino acid transport system permease protein